jgi:hypothetical protein
MPLSGYAESANDAVFVTPGIELDVPVTVAAKVGGVLGAECRTKPAAPTTTTPTRTVPIALTTVFTHTSQRS